MQIVGSKSLKTIDLDENSSGLAKTQTMHAGLINYCVVDNNPMQ